MRFDLQPPLVQFRPYRYRKFASISLAIFGVILISSALFIDRPKQDINLVENHHALELTTQTASLQTVPITETTPKRASTIENKAMATLDLQNELSTPAPANTSLEPKWKSHHIKSGDSLSTLFSAVGLSNKILHEIVNAHPAGKQLSKIHPGQDIAFLIDDQKDLQALTLKISPARSLKIEKRNEQYHYQFEEKPIINKTKYRTSTIDNSLFVAAKRAGLNNKLIMEFADIFGWDIDFALDIRKDDKFRLLHEDKYIEDTKISTGNITVAEFTNQGSTHQAIRYTNKQGQTSYYTPEGFNMQKAFIRNPVNFTRISSHFSLGRRHPILHRIRAHKGTDYAAPQGTPIKAAGDGRVLFIGVKGGYGKCIILQHGQKYTTLYAHQSRFARGLRTGQTVKQGQTIGYVGMTGLATAPHLHYEFRINGQHRNPLTVKLPKSLPISKDDKPKFLAVAKERLELLDTYEQQYLARK